MENLRIPKKYPSEWILGKPRGSIKENPTNYQLRVSTSNQDFNIYFKFCDYKSKNETYKACLKKQMEISDENDLTRNKIRYLDKDTIEVKLTQDKIMKTDSKFIKDVEKYPLNVKMKKTKDGETYYVMCQDKKLTFPFTNLISNFQNIRFKNGDTLDVRECNLMEFGQIEIKNEIIKDNNYELENQHEYFEYYEKNLINKLPKNKWILGKPSGSIFHRNNDINTYTICVLDTEQKQHTKTLNIKDYNNSHEKTKKEAEKLKINMSYKLGVTKNLIRLNENYIEVKIDESNIMKIDKFLLKLIQKINIHKAKNNISENYYASTSLNNIEYKFHRLITQYNNDYLVDHINGDTLDNRFENLRPVNHSLNNINRHTIIKGYKEVDTIFGKAIKVCTKLEKKEFSKYYSIEKYGYDQAIEMAKKFRKKIKLINSFDKTFIDELDEKEDKIMLKYLIKIIDKQKSIIMMSTNYNKNNYLEFTKDLKLDDKYKKSLFSNYIIQQIKLSDKIKEIHNLINEKIKNIMLKHFMDHLDNIKKFYLFKKL